jgi:4-amino-4-deoxy-L-arabinose transferase-like glycosyltransferase
MSGYIFTYGSRKYYILSGLLAGIAAAVKYLGGLALIALLVAHFLSRKEGRNINNLLLGIVMALVDF